VPVDGEPLPPALPIDLAANAESLGARVIRARGADEVRAALADAHGADGPVVIHVEVDRYAGVPSYEGWWDVPVAEVSEVASVQAARERYEADRPARHGYLSPTERELAR
jgi:3D-(3,5/4)-trihydroxycyclohexane-1,2-dione acylhydrolase (decyclizing)